MTYLGLYVTIVLAVSTSVGLKLLIDGGIYLYQLRKYNSARKDLMDLLKNMSSDSLVTEESDDKQQIH